MNSEKYPHLTRSVSSDFCTLTLKCKTVLQIEVYNCIHKESKLEDEPIKM